MSDSAYRDYDLILVGGGLANGLIAYCLHQRQPRLRVLVIERGTTLGGSHTWSFHTSDLPRPSLSWVGAFVTKYWHEHSLEFPRLKRRMESGYHSVRSEDFHRVITGAMPRAILFGHDVVDVRPEEVTLDDGTKLSARVVIDGRGFTDARPSRLGYQKFLGLDLRLEAPHRLAGPVIMDATCEQLGGYRFFYLLPWTERTLLVEDTRYSDSPAVDRAEYRTEILRYVERRGWRVAETLREEVGCLPIPLGEGDALARMRETGVALSGVRADLFHPTTGYSLPDGVRLAERLATRTDWSHSSTLEFFISHLEAHERRARFFRLLNRMMFDGAEPARRYEIFQRFYKLPEGLIRRFYAGEVTWLDIARILSGKPPIPVSRALPCLFEKKEAAVV